MNSTEFLFGLLVVLLLISLSAYFGWQQIVTLRRLKVETETEPLDQTFLKGQVWRRMFCCGLMLLLAALLVGSYFLEPEFQKLTSRKNAQTVQKSAGELPKQERSFLRRFTLYWIFFLLILFLFAFLAAWDVKATLRYGVQKHRLMKLDHELALQKELHRLRQERNGK